MPRAELPTLGNAPANLRSRRIFSQQASRIRDGYRRRLDRTNYMTPWDNPNGYLRREIYRLVRHFDSSDQGAAIQLIVRDAGREPRSPSYEQNMFHWGLLALEGPRGNLLTPQDRRKFANELLYANRHGVPELYLIGFLYQLGTQLDIHERVASPRVARIVRWIGSDR